MSSQSIYIAENDKISIFLWQSGIPLDVYVIFSLLINLLIYT